MDSGPDYPIVETCVSACRLEKPFLRRLLDECLQFSSKVVVSYCDTLYSGEPEDVSYFERLAHEYGEYQEHQDSEPRCIFVKYSIKQYLPETSTNACHNAARKAALSALDEARSRENVPHLDTARRWILFLDADEIPDGNVFRAWLGAHSGDLRHSQDAFKLGNYWYFLMPTLRADATEDSVLMLRRDHITEDGLNDNRERDGILRRCRAQRVRRMVTGPDGPMFHHYSWVRSRDDLLTKVTAWGHRADRPWSVLLERAWKEIDSGRQLQRDFVHGYRLTCVENRHELEL